MGRILFSVWPWLAALPALLACGAATPPAQTPAADDTATANPALGSDESAAPSDKKRPARTEARDPESAEGKPSPCVGFEIGDLAVALAQSACEVKGANPEASPQDVTNSLEVKAGLDSRRVEPGAKATVTVTYHNKLKKDLPLYFVVDPEPRFTFEVYTPKGVRVDQPAGLEPPLPPEVANAPAPERQFARITLAAEGTAKLTLPWAAVKHKWASKAAAKGAEVGHGYPQEPGGPLPRGKYVLRVVTPIAGISEGIDHELSQPRLDVEVGKP